MTQFAKWLRGRDLNPRPLGYEYNFLVARSFVFLAFIAVRCTTLASVGGIFRPNFRPTALPSRHVLWVGTGEWLGNLVIASYNCSMVSPPLILSGPLRLPGFRDMVIAGYEQLT